jgi:hypothetical protein
MSAEEPETEAGAANDATEVVDDDRLREAAGGQAWSEDEDEDDAEPERHPWSVVTGHAAALISAGAAVATITAVLGWIMLHKDRAAPSPLPPTSTAVKNTSPTAAAASAPPPEAAKPPPEEQINDAFIENIGGQTIPASTMEVPGLRILGSPQQWDDVTNKLRALGIEIRTDDAGYVTGVTFDNEDAKSNWQKWYARLKPTDQTQAADKNYVYSLEYNGVRIDDRVAMIKLGHQQCVFLAQPGNTVALAEQAIHNQYPQFSLDGKALEIIYAAVAAYCPSMRSWE